MNDTVFVGDADEFSCGSSDSDFRWVVWISTGKNGRVKETLLGRFEAYEEAEKFRADYLKENPATQAG